MFLRKRPSTPSVVEDIDLAGKRVFFFFRLFNNTDFAFHLLISAET